MTAKRYIKRTFRKARRNVCKFIVGYDRCPVVNRKNYSSKLMEALACLALCLGTITFFFALLAFVA